MSSSSSNNNTVMADDSSVVQVDKNDTGYAPPATQLDFEYNLITEVNHTYFSNVITDATAAAQSKYPKFFTDIFDDVASSRYDLIPADKFEGATTAAQQQYQQDHKDQSFVWFANNDPNVTETDAQKDARAALAFLPIIQNALLPHLTTKEFVTTVREQVLTEVWKGTSASIYSDPSLKAILAAETGPTDDKFFSVAQAGQIMKQFRLLGRIQSHTFDTGTHSFTDAQGKPLGDVEILWITFGNSDSIGVPSGFTAEGLAVNNDIVYNGVTYVAGSVLFALKFTITTVVTRALLPTPAATLVSQVENVTWQMKPGGARAGNETVDFTKA
jgi:hypothetical protein